MIMHRLPGFATYLPGRLVFGTNTIDDLGEIAQSLGRRALLVIGGGSLRQSGNLERAQRSLTAAGIGHELLEGVPAEPPVDWVDKGRAAAAQASAEMVIGIGGGSVIDVAKAVGALANERAPTREYHRGERDITEPGIPVIAVPTTAGTGAEVTPNSVLSDAERAVKASLRGRGLMPAVALVDPALTVSCPAWQTAYSGLDAIVQAIESYVSRGANPYSDALALRALQLMAPSIRTAVEDGSDLAAREAMALGSTMAGMALACARLGLVHGLAHPIGYLYGVPHGMVCGLLMPEVMEFNLPAATAKYATAARAIGLDGTDDDAAARALIDWMRALCSDLHVSRSLDTYGLREKDYDAIVPQVLASGSTKHNPREVTAEDVRALLDRLKA